DLSSEDVLEDAPHVSIGGMHLIDDKQVAEKSGGPEVRMSDHQRRQQYLVDRADNDGAGQITLGILRGPRAVAPTVAIGIRPQHCERCEPSTFSLVDSKIVWDRKDHRRGCLKCVIEHETHATESAV